MTTVDCLTICMHCFSAVCMSHCIAVCYVVSILHHWQQQQLAAIILVCMHSAQLRVCAGAQDLDCHYLEDLVGSAAVAWKRMRRGVLCRAIPVYLPVYVFPALLVHRKRLLNPKLAPDIGRRVVQGALRSSLFLSLYCTLAWRGACVGFQWSSKLLSASPSWFRKAVQTNC